MEPQAPIDIKPFFLESPRGRLFSLLLTPSGSAPRGAVLYLHPFAEEMHKSRRMAALQARALAARGQAVLQVDLSGCGDSSGDFVDASWSVWRDDARLAFDWLAHETGTPIILWGLRSGATLAVDLAICLATSGQPTPQRLLLWQPITSGDLFLNQFLRIMLAGEMLTGGHAQTGSKALRAQLEAGEPVEVGGNLLSPAMARELGSLKLADMPPPCPVTWFEVSAEAGDHVTPASQRVVDAWRASKTEVAVHTVQGAPFWNTQEITECQALLESTLEQIDSPS